MFEEKREVEKGYEPPEPPEPEPPEPEPPEPPEEQEPQLNTIEEDTAVKLGFKPPELPILPISSKPKEPPGKPTEKPPKEPTIPEVPPDKEE